MINFKKIFNLNSGYSIKELLYEYENLLYIGYIIYRRYIIFGIPIYEAVEDGCCCDMSALLERLNKIYKKTLK